MVECTTCNTKIFIPADLPPLTTTPCTKCQTPLMMPLTLRQFKLLQPIASGGMGTVYRAQDTTLQRQVAIKLIKPELHNDPQTLHAFNLEARAAAALNHTNIIHTYTFDQHQQHRYLVMELADNGSLDTRIETNHHLPELQTLDIGIKIAAALAAAHQKQLLHRDIKPGNILFNQENEPKLIDFGLATHDTKNTNYHGDIWGTPYYIAPEKINRQTETFLSDMYSLAGTLYHTLTGHVPFEADTIEQIITAHIHTPLTPPSHIQTDPPITQNTSDAIYYAMAKNPAHRYQSYDAFIMALESARSQLLLTLHQPQK